MKCNFEEPAIWVELFRVEDIVTASGMLGIVPGDDELPAQPISGNWVSNG